MGEFNVEVESGTSKRLLTAGKYCDRDIVVSATGGSATAQTVTVKLNLKPWADMMGGYVNFTADWVEDGEFVSKGSAAQ